MQAIPPSMFLHQAHALHIPLLSEISHVGLRCVTSFYKGTSASLLGHLRMPQNTSLSSSSVMYKLLCSTSKVCWLAAMRSCRLLSSEAMEVRNFSCSSIASVVSGACCSCVHRALYLQARYNPTHPLGETTCRSFVLLHVQCMVLRAGAPCGVIVKRPPGTATTRGGLGSAKWKAVLQIEVEQL